MTKGKWGTLLTTLIKFKEDYDANVALDVILPNLVAGFPDRYATMGLRDLSDEMFEHSKRSNQCSKRSRACQFQRCCRQMRIGVWCATKSSASHWMMLQIGSWQRASCLIHLASR